MRQFDTDCAKVLTFITSAGVHGVSRQAISEKFNVSAMALHARLAALRATGDIFIGKGNGGRGSLCYATSFFPDKDKLVLAAEYAAKPKLIRKRSSHDADIPAASIDGPLPVGSAALMESDAALSEPHDAPACHVSNRECGLHAGFRFALELLRNGEVTVSCGSVAPWEVPGVSKYARGFREGLALAFAAVRNGEFSVN